MSRFFSGPWMRVDAPCPTSITSMTSAVGVGDGAGVVAVGVGGVVEAGRSEIVAAPHAATRVRAGRARKSLKRTAHARSTEHATVTASKAPFDYSGLRDFAAAGCV